MRLTSIIFFIISLSFLIMNIVLKPIIEHNVYKIAQKDISLNYLHSLNKTDHRYWVIKNIYNESQTKTAENLYNIRALTKNQNFLNYVNFEILRNYQQFSDSDKILLIKN